jgi:phosphoglycolate phosphatase-like HAD superfamily hydrolase
MHVCFFDIDGTLINSGRAGRAAFYAALAHAFDVPEPHREVPFSGRTDRAIIGDMLLHHDLANTSENMRRFVAAYVEQLPVMLNGRGGMVLPGVEALLARLAERDDVAVGLLTGNMRIGAGIKLGHFDLMRHFRFGGYGDDHLDRDHVAADALAIAREHLQHDVRPERVWVIGDTPLDVRCARAIGAQAVAVATGFHTRDDLAATQPDILLDTLEGAEEMLGRMM